MAGKIEIRMIREIQYRVTIGRGRVIDAERVVFAQSISGDDLKISRISFFTVSAQIAKFEYGVPVGVNNSGPPGDFIEPSRAAVQCVRAIVLEECVRLAVELEFAVCNT